MKSTKFEYEIIKTSDQSPTVRLFAGEQKEAQCMHHLGGALSESHFIYLDAAKAALRESQPPHFLSVGLGLGYNELLTIAEIATHTPKKLDQLTLISYESEPLLSNSLVKYLKAKPLPEDWFELYEKIFTLVAEKFDLSPGRLKKMAEEALTSNKWQVRGALSLENLPQESFSVIYFDAFSRAASPQLWTEEFFDRLFSCSTKERSLFVTYAVTGNLKRSFKRHDFEVFKRPGFKGKRESTWAVKRDPDGQYLKLHPPKNS